MEVAEEGNGFLESPDLDPQLFINEVFNCVDDLHDDALLTYRQQATKLLKIEGSERTTNLNKGVAYIGNKIRLVMDKYLGMWEKYCLQECFNVPNGLPFSKSNSPPGETSASKEVVADYDELVDTQLDSLRNQLQAAREESDELNRELQALEMESASDDHIAKIIKEVLETCEQNSGKDLFHDMMVAADELRSKVRNVKSKLLEEKEMHRMHYLNGGTSVADSGTGLSWEKLGDLGKFLNDLKQS